MGSFSLLKRIEESGLEILCFFRLLQFYLVGLLSSFQKRGGERRLKKTKKALSLYSNVESKKDEYNPDDLKNLFEGLVSRGFIVI